MPKKGNWRDHLMPGDEAEITAWVMRSGLERAARIIATLADPHGERGPTVHPDAPLLLRLARIKLDDPTRGNHSIAAELAQGDKNLLVRLRDRFRTQQGKWEDLVRQSSPSDIDRDRLCTPDEARVLDRLTTLLPGAIDLYGELLVEVQRSGRKDMVYAIKRIGREPVEEKLAARLRGAAPGAPTQTARSFLDLVAADLFPEAGANYSPSE
jgi:hypothetical protein